MPHLSDLGGRHLQIIGSAVALLLVLGRLTFLGRLPGDISACWASASFTFPLAACLVLTASVNVIPLLFRRK